MESSMSLGLVWLLVVMSTETLYFFKSPVLRYRALSSLDGWVDDLWDKIFNLFSLAGSGVALAEKP
jgi:hypothetical protein